MAVCPAGHVSAADDFCDICGMRIGGTPTPTGGLPATGTDLPATGPGTPQGAGEPCPRCGTTRTGQFCEGCGFNFDADPRTLATSPPVTSPPVTSPPVTSPPLTSPPLTSPPPASPPPAPSVP